MKLTLIAISLAVLAGCAQFRDGEQSSAASGSTASPDGTTANQPAYPYNSRYGI